MKHTRLLIGLLLLLNCLGLQAAPISGAFEQPLVEVLDKLQQEYEVVISYNVKDLKNVNVQFAWQRQEAFDSVIRRVLKDTQLSYRSVGLNFYVIYKASRKNQRKLGKLEKRIEGIRKMSNQEDFRISNYHSLSAHKQPQQISGKILSETGEPLYGATVLVVGTQQGTTSDLNGDFELLLPKENKSVVISYTGFFSKAINLSEAGTDELVVRLREGIHLEEVTVFGLRGAPRTIFDSSVPVDNFSTEALGTTGKMTLDEQLAQLAPSFNSSQHPVSDASAHFNPIDLRGMLPSRTLVLVNGKRKNASALLYSYVTASRGEVGVDLKSISADAVKDIEVLRDGAAAQYGSDAIAGVINIELKEKIAPFINTSYSTTGALDGAQFQLSSGFSLDIQDKGFATFVLNYHQQNRSQRAGTISSPEDEAAQWGTSVFSLEDFSHYLDRNPGAGFQVGLPDINVFNTSFNSAYVLDKVSDTELYAFGTLMSRRGSSPQFARGPYWVTGFEAIYPGADYFLPEMAPTIFDGMTTVGVKHSWRGWKADLSLNLGQSRIDYFIKNSFNQSLGSASPKDFYNGAHQFTNWVNNLDVSKSFPLQATEKISVAFGLEQRLETFSAFSGEFASYGDATPDLADRIGSESFSGLSPEDVVHGSRNNIGIYTELTGDLSPRLQLGGASRYEYYSDFGGNLSWKFNGLFKALPNKLNVRGAFSNGFRAPSLHQIHFTSTTTTLTPEGVVQNRILNNLDPALEILQIPKLMPESSLNLSVGLTCKLTDKFDFSLDIYRIKVKDRIVLSGQIGRQATEDSPINQLLESTNTNSAGFFLNAVATVNTGIDMVFNLQNIQLGRGNVRASLAANLNRSEVTDIRLPSFINDGNLRSSIFSREDVSRLETWRPGEKVLLSLHYTRNKISTRLAFNYYGSVTYRHSYNEADDATYGGKMISNWSLGYELSNVLKCQIGVENLFNVFPDAFEEAYQGVPNDRNIDFVGRFKYPWQTQQIGIDGIRALLN